MTPTMDDGPAEILGAGGRLGRHLPQCEFRPQQLELAEAIAGALAAGRHLLAEAGTGVGKSLAYLVPALQFIAARKAEGLERPRVVVSTHTISLQEQLIEKDLPLLARVMTQPFRAVLAKGQGNYLSLRRLRIARERAGSLWAEEGAARELRMIDDWIGQTTEGSLGDIPFQPTPSVWQEVASDTHNCLGRRCPTHSECFYFRARARLNEADLLVVNHALFFSDLALRREGAAILPEYDAVVFDEAHTLEAVAAQHLGLSITSGQVEYHLGRLLHEQSGKGLLATLGSREAERLTQRCRQQAERFFHDIYQWRLASPQKNGRVLEPAGPANALSPPLAELGGMLKKLGEQQQDESHKQDLQATGLRLQQLAADLEGWLAQEQAESVYWVEAEARRGRPRVVLQAAPTSVADVLRGELLAKVGSAVFVSATLTVGAPPSFEFFASRLGLEKVPGLSVGSPFNYPEQMELVLVRGLPEPAQERAYDAAAARAIAYFTSQTGGRAFALFTSYGMLQRVAEELAEWAEREGIQLIRQGGDLSRAQMLELFRREPRSLLMGVDSFWQGVDVPGDALRNVMIVKLPFSVPDHPLLEARLEKLRCEGGNPFFDYQLPEAAIKLRQGVGRLIRTAGDEGMVVLLDPRLHTKRYGGLFLGSLPPGRRTTVEFSSLPPLA